MPETGRKKKGSEKSRKPESMYSQFTAIFKQVVSDKKAFLEEEFGGSSDYGIRGAVVVGSVAERKERPDSDIDFYLLASSEGWIDDFLEELDRRCKPTLDFIGVIRLVLGQTFTPENWDTLMEEKGYYHTGYKIFNIN